MSIYKYTAICLLALATMFSCKKAEIEGPGYTNPDALTPVDLVLNMYYPQAESIDDYSRSARRTITLGNVSDQISSNVAAPKLSDAQTRSVNTSIRDLNIFMFYNDPKRPDFDTIVRHYYLTAETEDLNTILLKDLYIGTYEMYVIANNKQSVCADHNSHYGCSLTPDQVKALWSSTETSASDKNIMSYYNSSISVNRFGNGEDASQNIFDIKLELLATKIDLFVENKLADDGIVNDYIELISYSLTNASNSTPFFEQTNYELCPDYEDLTYARPVTNPTGNTNISADIYILPNYRGEGNLPSATSHRDRTIANAPEGATALLINMDYYEGRNMTVLSYIIFLGKTGDSYGFNNYDVKKGVCYEYDVTVGSPDLDDPRVMSLKVNNETEIFQYYNSEGTLVQIPNKLPHGTVIGRSLSVEFSNAFDNKLLLSVEGVIQSQAPGATFEIWDMEQTTRYYPNDETLESEYFKISEFLIPDELITMDSPDSNISKSDFFIKYYHDAGIQGNDVTVNAMISVQTTSGLLRIVKPSTNSSQQSITFANIASPQ